VRGARSGAPRLSGCADTASHAVFPISHIEKFRELKYVALRGSGLVMLESMPSADYGSWELEGTGQAKGPWGGVRPPILWFIGEKRPRRAGCGGFRRGAVACETLGSGGGWRLALDLW
jgi:hypothetical protein